MKLVYDSTLSLSHHFVKHVIQKLSTEKNLHAHAGIHAHKPNQIF